MVKAVELSSVYRRRDRLARNCVQLLWLLLSTFLLSIRPAQGQTLWQPPGELSVPSNHRPAVPRELITSLLVGRFMVVLEQTKLSDVQAHLGGTIGQRGDASESLAWLCVHGSDGPSSWALWLEAGEIHGGTIGALQLRHVTSGTHIDPRCASVGSTPGIQLPNGIRFGFSTRTQTVEALGRPTASTGDTLLYAHEHQETIHGETATVSNRLTIRFRSGVLDAVDVWKMTVS